MDTYECFCWLTEVSRTDVRRPNQPHVFGCRKLPTDEQQSVPPWAKHKQKHVFIHKVGIFHIIQRKRDDSYNMHHQWFTISEYGYVFILFPYIQGMYIDACSLTIPCADYQMRIAYASYRMILELPGGERHTAFTRILHRTDRDKDPLAEEIPTFRADPLQPECDDWCEYPVSDRANAVKQFWKYGQKAEILKEDWFYAIESDYVFMKPLELPSGKDAKSKAYGFSFYYINPAMHPEEMKVLYPGGDPSKVAGTGPAPILMTLENWLKVTEEWERLAALIESKDKIKQRLGWVREMYGFSVALAIKGIEVELDGTDKNRFISELPHFNGLGNAHAYHYTLATIFKTIDGKDVWGYDKRFHVDPSEVSVVPKIELPPPFEQGKWKFVEGNRVTKEKYDAIYEMISQMNNAIITLKPL